MERIRVQANRVQGFRDAATAHKARTAMAAFVVLMVAGAIVAATSTTHAGKPTTLAPFVATDRKLAAPNPPVFSQPDAVASSSAGASSAGGSAAGGTGGGTASAAPTPASSSAPSLVAPGGPKVVKTASMRVLVGRGRFDAAFDAANAVASRYQGYVSDSSSQTRDRQAAEGTLTLRVPADRFDAARADLARLGKVDHVEISGQDVSAQLVDFAARVRSLQSQEQALQTLLSRARSVGEVLEVQGQLFGVRQQIEQLQAQQANLDAQASFATLSVTLFEPGAALTPTRPVPVTGLVHSWHLAVHGSAAVVGGMLVVLGYLFPAALLAALAWLATRLWNRRRRTDVAPVA